MRIYLIGFMGSGKSTIGKKIAAKLDYAFIDLDKLMEEVEKNTVAGIFSEKGEEYFRKTEADILHSTILHKNAVISCGGGTPCYFDNMDWMNARGITVYLKMKAETLYGRLKTKKEKRPLIAKLSNEQLRDYIFQKLSEREAFYLQAALIADPENMKIKEIAESIRGKMKKR